MWYHVYARVFSTRTTLTDLPVSRLFRHYPTPPQPRVLPPDVRTEGGGGDASPPSSPLPNVAADALDEQGLAFSSLLRADVGRALGVSMKAVAVGDVFPAGETLVDWQAWRQWGEGALNVSLSGMDGGRRGTRAPCCSWGPFTPISIDGQRGNPTLVFFLDIQMKYVSYEECTAVE